MFAPGHRSEHRPNNGEHFDIKRRFEAIHGVRLMFGTGEHWGEHRVVSKHKECSVFRARDGHLCLPSVRSYAIIVEN